MSRKRNFIIVLPTLQVATTTYKTNTILVIKNQHSSTLNYREYNIITFLIKIKIVIGIVWIISEHLSRIVNPHKPRSYKYKLQTKYTTKLKQEKRKTI